MRIGSDQLDGNSDTENAFDYDSLIEISEILLLSETFNIRYLLSKELYKMYIYKKYIYFSSRAGLVMLP